MGPRRPVAGIPIVLPVTRLLIASPGDAALALGAVRRAVEAVDERMFAFTDETVQ
jgi:hypothetical protein